MLRTWQEATLTSLRARPYVVSWAPVSDSLHREIAPGKELLLGQTGQGEG